MFFFFYCCLFHFIFSSHSLLMRLFYLLFCRSTHVRKTFTHWLFFFCVCKLFTRFGFLNLPRLIMQDVFFSLSLVFLFLFLVGCFICIHTYNLKYSLNGCSSLLLLLFLWLFLCMMIVVMVSVVHTCSWHYWLPCYGTE